MIDIYPIGNCEISLWGLRPLERLRRTVARLGRPVTVHASPAEPMAGESAVLIRRDWVFEDRVIEALIERPATLLMAGDGNDGTAVAAHVDAASLAAARALVAAGSGDMAALTAMTPAALVGQFHHSLRKRETPLVLPVREDTRGDVERQLFKASYKGVTDVITKYLWPRPAFHVTRLCARLGLSPNFVTAVSLVLVVVTLWLFWQGAFWAGLAAAYGMIFLDTVDGKLARVTLTSSKWGNVFDHGIDLVHPPFWYWAWYVGLETTGYGDNALMESWGAAAFAAIIAAYVLDRVAEGVFIKRFDMHIHVWRPVDSLMREVAARRNPNLIILTLGLAAGRPDTGFVLVAVWSLVCLAFHLVRLGQAMHIAGRNGVIRSWLSEESGEGSTT